MQVLLIVLLLATIWFWWDSSGTKEVAMAAARTACRQANVQLLDATVTLRKIRPQRDKHGRLQLARLYAFEFSETGHQRNHGYVVTLGKSIYHMELALSEESESGENESDYS